MKEMFQALMNDIENTYNIEQDIWVSVGDSNGIDLNLYKDEDEGWTLTAYPVANGKTYSSHGIRLL